MINHAQLIDSRKLSRPTSKAGPGAWLASVASEASLIDQTVTIQLQHYPPRLSVLCNLLFRLLPDNFDFLEILASHCHFQKADSLQWLTALLLPNFIPKSHFQGPKLWASP